MFIDYNLFGMNFINVDAVKFRPPLPDAASTTDSIISGKSTVILFFSVVLRISSINFCRLSFWLPFPLNCSVVTYFSENY